MASPDVADRLLLDGSRTQERAIVDIAWIHLPVPPNETTAPKVRARFLNSIWFVFVGVFPRVVVNECHLVYILAPEVLNLVVILSLAIECNARNSGDQA